MNHLRRFGCGVHGTKFRKDSLDSFEKTIGSFSSLEDTNVEVERQEEVVKRERKSSI